MVHDDAAGDRSDSRALSDGSADGIRLTYAEVDVAELVRLIAAFFATHIAGRGIKIDVVAPDEARAQVDQEQLRRVLFNLLGNAVGFTPDDGRIRFELRRKDGWVAFDVADSGPGVAPAERELIFERFGHGSAEPSQLTHGTGLGLSIVRDLVSRHGGTVSVGDAPEGGALFTVRLPAQAPADMPVHGAVPVTWDEGSLAAGAPGPEPEGGTAGAGDDSRPLVLVVEENPELSRIIGESLADSYRTVAAFDGRAGLAAAREHLPSLVITDVTVPASGGGQLVAAIRKDPALATTAVLVLNARDDDVARLQLLLAGANDYLVKPFMIDELRARVGNLTALQQAEATLRELSVSDDRDRIARDLHDVVIQRLFAVAMRMDRVRDFDIPPSVNQRIVEAVDELDQVIRDIRSTIFDLQHGPGSAGVRAAAMTLTADAARRLGCAPKLVFNGPVDTLVEGPVATNLLAVLQEALSNTVRHSYGSMVDVTIDATAEAVTLIVRDDGVGPNDEPSGGEGLRNMASRAAALGGTCTVQPNRPMGTEVTWRVPL